MNIYKLVMEYVLSIIIRSSSVWFTFQELSNHHERIKENRMLSNYQILKVRSVISYSCETGAALLIEWTET